MTESIFKSSNAANGMFITSSATITADIGRAELVTCLKRFTKPVSAQGFVKVGVTVREL